MEEYHKIQSLYLRDPGDKHKTFLMGQYTTAAFEYLADNPWLWTEKIDGTNVRIGWNGISVRIGGKTDDAQMPIYLIERLQEMFPPEKMAGCFSGDTQDLQVTLYGEGYGAK